MTEWYFEVEGQQETVRANTLQAAVNALMLWWKWQSSKPLPPFVLKGAK